MSEGKRLSLKVKYMLLTTGIVTLFVGGYSCYLLLQTKEQEARDNRNKALFVAEIVKSGLMAVSLPDGDHGSLKNMVRSLAAEDVLAVRLLREDGTVIASSVDSDEEGLPISPAASGSSSRNVARNLEGSRIYHHSMPLRNEKPCQECHSSRYEALGTLMVSVSRVGRPVDSIWTQREKAVITSLLIIIGLVASLGLVASFLIGKPLDELMTAVRKAESGDLSPHLHTERNDELGYLWRKLGTLFSEISRKSNELEACHVETMQKVERMATIGELASAIAHEIKNPLAGISGAIQVFAEDFADGDPRKDIIMEVLSEIERLDKAVRDLLSFARPPEPHFIRTPVDSVLERSIRLIAGHAKKQNVDVNIVAEDDPVDIRIDPEQMQQVFLNIMMNALHSMPQGGRLIITTRMKAKDGNVVVSFSDTGQGIPNEETGNIFKPFYTTKHTGTGLGLAISKNIVEKHGGNIVVESEVGSGTSFRVLLPLEGKHV